MVRFADLNCPWSEQEQLPKALEVWAPDPGALAQAVLLEDWKQSATPCPALRGTINDQSISC